MNIENFNDNQKTISSCQNEMDSVSNQNNIFLENYEKIRNIFENKLNINNLIANDLTKKIFTIQKQIKENDCIIIPVSENFPYAIIVKKDRVYCFIKKIGEGTYSNVYENLIIATQHQQYNGLCLSPSKPENFAIKVSKKITQSYSPEKKTINQATSPTKRGIDYPIETFKDVYGNAFSVHEKYEMDVSSTPYSELRLPAHTIIKIYSAFAGTLSRLHHKGFIHRDIKGPNLLIALEKGLFAITDFGFLWEEKPFIHLVKGTPSYLDPLMFGTAGETLINQKNRIGHQTKEGDVFALGLTLIKDTLLKLIYNTYGKSDNAIEIYLILKNFERKEIIGPFNNEFLQQIGEKYPFRIMYKGGQEEKLFIYPTLSEYRQGLTECFSLLDDCFSQHEIEALIELSELGCDMQEIDNNKRPSAEQVYAQLSDIYLELKSNYDSQESSEESECSESSERNEEEISHSNEQNYVGNSVEETHSFPFNHSKSESHNLQKQLIINEKSEEKLLIKNQKRKRDSDDGSFSLHQHLERVNNARRRLDFSDLK